MSENELDMRLFERPIAYQPWLAKVIGSVTAALLLSQLLYWQKTKDAALNPNLAESKDEGWVWKTEKEWSEETGMGPKEVKNAIERLISLNLVEIRENRLAHKRYFKIIIDNLAKISRGAETASREVPKRHLDHITENTTEKNANDANSVPAEPMASSLVHDGLDHHGESLSDKASSVPIESMVDFDCQAYLEKIKVEGQPHVKLIAKLLLATEQVFPSKAAVSDEIKRQSKATIALIRQGWSEERLRAVVNHMLGEKFWEEKKLTMASVLKRMSDPSIT